jgi:hypothetical protein
VGSLAVSVEKLAANIERFDEAMVMLAESEVRTNRRIDQLDGAVGAMVPQPRPNPDKRRAVAMYYASASASFECNINLCISAHDASRHRHGALPRARPLCTKSPSSKPAEARGANILACHAGTPAGAC